MALHAVAVATDPLLAQLERGEISLDEFLDARVDKALARVKGRVSEERLKMLREVVSEHLRTDPVTLELIRRVTGLTPSCDSAEANH
jgi:hypothetical protein